ncbi:TylF/MycF/NovP-related O-methyltransferase [Streptomyces sp. H10-C2]|uniref:TylF/MycF/NovP-related O-methyltransferase n=1 Tax=unclassified Streptomyces TaxID=2593676 RepID=UPI0024B95A20|nr:MULTISPECIES: TylF/MycF/NovP-related O-methyltransferase [unclassified Streptomyces]MDJ0341173.1 TylF/MycF/NovP-related O-methyltransferase [Streptomyces sp. PH10-H1]MDJ0369474.1 TylF/MycF/NovP-related O-methyltransferase [Streptomyces sp. H10-C2]
MAQPDLASQQPRPATDEDDPRRVYLDLLKRTLTRYAFGETRRPIVFRQGFVFRWLHLLAKYPVERKRWELVRRCPFDAEARSQGRDYPAEAETMVGLSRLDNLEQCITDVLDRDVAGDLIETGVWRGGASIFMRAVLKAYGDRDRVVWCADSFNGLPKPDAALHPDDAEDALWDQSILAVSLDEVRSNFERYGLLDERVKFLPGWFKDTLPTAPIEKLSVLRLDGDLYESTMVALQSLYPKLTVGGYVIVDDYHAIRGCRRAVDDFRSQHGIEDEMLRVDWTCVFWRRSK